MTANPNQLIQPFGYTEMYEWVRVPQDWRFGLFVQFNKRYPNMIEPSHDAGGIICGVSSICSVIESDNPPQWKYSYMCNDVGDTYMKEETLAIGVKCYDEQNEMSYMSTRPWKHYVKVPNAQLDSRRQYIPRTARNEWVRVTILGKAIVRDDGVMKPGEWCMPYHGDDMKLAGSAIPWDGKSEYRFYVLERITENTCLIMIR